MSPRLQERHRERDRDADDRRRRRERRHDPADVAEQQGDQQGCAEAGDGLADGVDRARLLEHEDVGEHAGDQQDGGPADLADRALVPLRGEQRQDDGDGDRDEADVELEDERQDGDHDQPDEREDLLERHRLRAVGVFLVRVAGATADPGGQRGAVSAAPRRRLPSPRAPASPTCSSTSSATATLRPISFRPPRTKNRTSAMARLKNRLPRKTASELLGQPLVLDDRVHRDAVDADGGEAAALRAVDHHHAHEQRVDPVPDGEGQRDRRDDRDRRGRERADRGQQRGDREHDPRDGGDVAADQAHRSPDQQVDGAVVLRDGEQVRDADQREHELGREPARHFVAAEDLLGGQADRQRADDERGDERQRAHVDREDGRDREDHDQRDDGDDLG